MTKQRTFHKDTPQAVRNILLNAYTGQRFRFFYGDTKTGKAWAEEHEVIGQIGWSTGSESIPLLIANTRCHGGRALSDGCIVAIINCGARAWVYKHPRFDAGLWIVKPDSEHPGLTHAAFKDGELQARFKTEAQALRYVQFMQGLRMAK